MTATTIKSTLFVLIAAFSFVFPSFYVAADNTKQMSESIFEVNNASQFVKPSLLNKKQTVRTNDSKKEIKYFGTIKNTRGKILYYVLTVYSEVQAAIQVHGNSNIIYLDSNKKLFKQYGLGGPEELPFKFDKNVLYFHYIDAVTKKKKLFLNKVGTAPPTIMCVEPDNCY